MMNMLQNNWFSNAAKTAAGLALVFSSAAMADDAGHAAGGHGPQMNDPATAAYHKASAELLRQSPINLVSGQTQPAGLLNMNVDYKPAPLTVTNDGHTIRVDYPEGSTMQINGHTFNLKQCHWHFPSEYAIDGKVFDGELHCVHMDAKGNLGVIGVLISEGKEHPEAAKIWQHFPEKGETKTVAGVRIDADNFIPKDMKHYSLMGSLTTASPGHEDPRHFKEGVNWTVITTPIEFSKGQIEQFRAKFEPNARPLQARNNRPIYLNYP
jgi:carbonic anhydrase